LCIDDKHSLLWIVLLNNPNFDNEYTGEITLEFKKANMVLIYLTYALDVCVLQTGNLPVNSVSHLQKCTELCHRPLTANLLLQILNIGFYGFRFPTNQHSINKSASFVPGTQSSVFISIIVKNSPSID
jgi:hypothetical protein